MNLLISQLILILISKKEHRLHLKPHLQNHQHQHLIAVDPNYPKHLQLRELHQEIFQEPHQEILRELHREILRGILQETLKKSFDFKDSSSSYANRFGT